MSAVMTFEERRAGYAEITAPLDPADVCALWTGVLLGRKFDDARLRDAAVQFEALYDRIRAESQQRVAGALAASRERAA